MKLSHSETNQRCKNRAIRRLSASVPALISVLFFSCFCWGQEPKTNPLEPKVPMQRAPEVKPPPHAITAADVEAFLDGIVPVQLERDDIAGAVISIVKDGKQLFAQGYGFADVKERKPVSAENTLFRPGSISKLFTWTAVMQLVEQGKLNLDHDVNDYLDFKIPSTYPQPITLRNIMTHTSGFGETAKDLILTDPKDLTPLRAYLVGHMPARIFPPGVTPAYSNYATSMAGYIVQRVSGVAFDDYINKNIFQPLDMQHTTFVQPLPDNLKPLMSNGYKLASSPPGKFELVQPWPAGSVSMSATDMTHFMLAHLQNGEYNGVRILRPETVQQMHSRQFAPHPGMNAMALGFYEETRNGHRIIGHGGDTVYFHSDLHLIPDAGIGFFVSYNSSGKGGSGRTELWEKFLDRYFPYTPPSEPTASTAPHDGQIVSGLYMSSRRMQGNILEATALLGEMKISSDAQGTIWADALKDFDGQPKKFHEIGPLMYRAVNGQDRLAFRRDANGRLYAAIDFPFFIFQRVGWLQSKTFNYFVLIAGVAVALLTLILWPVAALVRRHYRRKLLLSRQERWLRIAVRLVCALDLIFLASLVALVSSTSDPSALNGHIDSKIHLMQVLGLIGALGALIAIYNAVQAWRAPSSSAQSIAPIIADETEVRRPPVPVSGTREFEWAWGKVFATVIALACIGLAWFFFYWNLLNFNLKY